jgi:probable F420-dependent oxidoreductase
MGAMSAAHRAIIERMSETKAIPGIEGYGGRRLAQRFGRFGAWSFALQRLAARDEIGAARQIEDFGYPVIWMPESLGSKDVLAHSAILLAGTERVAIAPGIANIHARDPMAMANGARALGDAYPDRFVLGIGVSHAPSVAMRGGDYGNPIERMTAYLDAMADAQYAAPLPETPVPLVLAALGPRMLELAAARTDGAHPYFVPLEHTPYARRHLGPEPWLAVEMTAVLTTDRSAGLATARAFAKHYLALPNYANNLRRLGWGDDDIGNDGSDRLLEQVVAVGDVDHIVARARAHLDAGADHVCIQLREERSADPAIEGFRELAAALGLG